MTVPCPECGTASPQWYVEGLYRCTECNLKFGPYLDIQAAVHRNQVKNDKRQAELLKELEGAKRYLEFVHKMHSEKTSYTYRWPYRWQPRNWFKQGAWTKYHTVESHYDAFYRRLYCLQRLEKEILWIARHWDTERYQKLKSKTWTKKVWNSWRRNYAVWSMLRAVKAHKRDWYGE